MKRKKILPLLFLPNVHSLLYVTENLSVKVLYDGNPVRCVGH